MIQCQESSSVTDASEQDAWCCLSDVSNKQRTDGQSLRLMQGKQQQQKPEFNQKHLLEHKLFFVLPIKLCAARNCLFFFLHSGFFCSD